MDRFVIISIVLCVWRSSVAGQSQSTPTNSINDPISPIISFLEQLQRLRELYASAARQTQNSFAPVLPTVSSQNRTSSVLSFLQSTVSPPLGQNSITEQANTNNNNNNNGNNGNNAAGPSFTLQLPSFGRQRRPQTDIQRVNQGLTDILEGVRMASLERILRGSFSFTRNDNVRSVADTVLNSLFRPLTPRIIRNRNQNQDNINGILNTV